MLHRDAGTGLPFYLNPSSKDFLQMPPGIDPSNRILNMLFNLKKRPLAALHEQLGYLHDLSNHAQDHIILDYSSR